MKKIFLLLLFPLLLHAEEATISNFRGWVTKTHTTKADTAIASEILNVWTNEYQGALTRRKGSVDYLNTAFGGTKWVRRLFTYQQVDGDQYIIANSSTSVFYSQGDGNSAFVKQGLSASFTSDYTTCKDSLYGTDGSTWPYKWDGTTLTNLDSTNSTGTVVAKYHIYWKNRRFVAGNPAAPSTIYYSEVADPDNRLALSTLNINISDGDFLTGLFVWYNKLFATKRYSTWEVEEISPGYFVPRNVSEKIGCLYKTTMDEWQGFPIWLSDRGVEVFDGKFNLVSEPIDDYIKRLRQLGISENKWTQTLPLDWGAGSGIFIDTTTVSGSVGIDQISWTSRDSDRTWRKVAVSSSGSIQLAGPSGNLYLSTDTGVTWSAKANSRNWWGVAMSSNGSIQSATVNSGAIYLSTDTGATWNVANSDSRSWREIAMSESGDVLTSLVYFGYIYVSTNSGSTWAQRGTSEIWQDIAVSSNGSIQTAVGDNVQIYVSTDTGLTWSAKDSVRVWRGIAMSADGKIQTAVTSSDIYISTDTGNTWVAQGISSVWNDIAMSADGSIQSAISRDEELYISLDSGDNWTNNTSGISWPFNDTILGIAMSADGINQTSVFYEGGVYTAKVYGTALFTSQVFNAGTDWGSWGNLTVDDTIPSNSAISYYAQASGLEATIDSQPVVSVSNGGPINLSTGPYIHIISSFSRTDIDADPLQNSFSLEYSKTGDLYIPIGIVYKDNYYLGVSVGDNIDYNDEVPVLQANGEWTRFDNMNIGSACLYRNSLYTGDGDDTGMIYRQDVTNVYADSGASYESYWIGKKDNYGSIMNKKRYHEMWAAAENSGAWDLNISYRIGNTWIDNTMDLTTGYNGLVVKKFPFPWITQSYYIQYKISMNGVNEFFKFLELSTVYEKMARE